MRVLKLSARNSNQQKQLKELPMSKQRQSALKAYEEVIERRRTYEKTVASIGRQLVQLGEQITVAQNELEPIKKARDDAIRKASLKGDLSLADDSHKAYRTAQIHIEDLKETKAVVEAQIKSLGDESRIMRNEVDCARSSVASIAYVDKLAELKQAADLVCEAWVAFRDKNGREGGTYEQWLLDDAFPRINHDHAKARQSLYGK
jgi:hypothetical protein